MELTEIVMKVYNCCYQRAERIIQSYEQLGEYQELLKILKEAGYDV